MDPLVVAITGASGAPYAVRLLECLQASSIPVHLTISPSGAQVLKQELDIEIDLNNFQASDLLKQDAENFELEYHFYQNFMAAIASGSFKTSGMVVAPCSGSTLGGIASGRYS